MTQEAYQKRCKQCKQDLIFDNFYPGYATCRACYRVNHTKTLNCLDCGVEAEVFCTTRKKATEYRCQPCGTRHGILKSFEDPEKHKAWKDRTDGKKMRAAVKNPYLPPAGELNPAWKGGLPNCEDCGKQVCDRAFTLCVPCSHKRRRKPIHTCCDCKTPLKKRWSKRCQPCRVKWQRGENAPMWQGGKSSESQNERNAIETRIWSKAILKRDRFTCRNCGLVAGSRKNPLHAHHRKRWADHKELRFDVSNGITLCRDCHLNVAHQGRWFNKPVDIWG